MVATIIWVPPWVVITISLSGLFVITTIFFYCICWKKKRMTSRFYVLDENGLRASSISEFAQNSLTNLKLYRRLSTNKEDSNEIKNEIIFTSKNLPFFKVTNNMVSDSELLDSMDGLKSFENSTLQLDCESQSETKEDLYSCVSSESRYTFHSVHPVAKSNSRGTFVSVEFNSDTETLVD